MPAPSLVLPERLTNSCSKKRKDRVLIGQYGDGYKQVANDGLNSKIDQWDLSYMALEGADLATLRSFIDTVGCVTWFTWTPFGESTAKKWSIVKDSVKEKLFTTSLVEISFSIEQRFDLGS